jgi:endothelin-converting enzyme
MSLEDADKLAPEIGLNGVIAGLASEGAIVPQLIVMAPAYMKSLSKILSETKKDVLQSYFVWKAVQSLAHYIDADAIKPYNHLLNVLAGKVSRPAPFQKKTDLTNNVGS